jgi:hypothetical protein
VHRRRRNGTVAGTVMLLGALVVGAGSALPCARIASPGFVASSGTTMSAELGFGDLSNSHQSGADATKALLIGAALLIGILGLALILTRVRGLGVLWRILALVALVLPASVTVVLWNYLNSSPADVLSDPTANMEDKLQGLGLSRADDLGILTIKPATGLWLLSAGTLLTFIALWIPATRPTVTAPLPNRPAPASTSPQLDPSSR